MRNPTITICTGKPDATEIRHVRFGKGSSEKDPNDGHLAGDLLHRMPGSVGAAGKWFTYANTSPAAYPADTGVNRSTGTVRYVGCGTPKPYWRSSVPSRIYDTGEPSAVNAACSVREGPLEKDPAMGTSLAAYFTGTSGSEGGCRKRTSTTGTSLSVGRWLAYGATVRDKGRWE
jgi:hypothetical protein